MKLFTLNMISMIQSSGRLRYRVVLLAYLDGNALGMKKIVAWQGLVRLIHSFVATFVHPWQQQWVHPISHSFIQSFIHPSFTHL